MYLKDTRSGNLVEVMDLAVLFDPCRSSLPGRIHAGEELQEPEEFTKSALVFPSDEPLPRCWLDAGYRHAVR